MNASRRGSSRQRSSRCGSTAARINRWAAGEPGPPPSRARSRSCTEAGKCRASAGSAARRSASVSAAEARGPLTRSAGPAGVSAAIATAVSRRRISARMPSSVRTWAAAGTCVRACRRWSSRTSRGAVELRHIVGAVAACQHQLVDRDRIGLDRRPPPRLAETALGGPLGLARRRRACRPQIQVTALVRHGLDLPIRRHRRKRQGNPGAACHCVVADIGKLLPIQ